MRLVPIKVPPHFVFICCCCGVRSTTAKRFYEPPACADLEAPVKWMYWCGPCAQERAALHRAADGRWVA